MNKIYIPLIYYNGDKMDKVGIPRSIFYYYYGDIWKYYLNYLKIPYIISPNTNKEIMANGLKYSGDEMCLALKTYIGHVHYLQNKCDYILVPRIDNYGLDNQTCTNFLSAYDIIKNTFQTKILNYNINQNKNETLEKGLIKIGKTLNQTKRKCKKAYKYAIKKYEENRKREIEININKLNSPKTKILIISHPYNTYDDLIGKEITKYLTKNNIEIIYSDKFDEKITNKQSKQLSKDLYFKYSKDNIGSIIYAKDKIDGIIFLSAFPCGPDSLVNELVMRKINIPHINLVLDDTSSFTGTETRLESFIDMIKGGLND